MDQAAKQPRKCPGLDCEKDASTLQCPTCLKNGVESFFCSQDCFKRSWNVHRKVHPQSIPTHTKVASFNPFPTYKFTGPLRPLYNSFPLTEKRPVPASIRRPDYAEDGVPKLGEKWSLRNNITILDKEAQDGMRKVCRLAREVLDAAARELKPGVTTDYIDEVVHKACIERNSYPSTLNYRHYPKSLCTSANEVICHGIPDQRALEDGDIINLDVTLYHGGFHGDLNETYYVGDKALADPNNIRLVETTRECLDKAIANVKPGMLFKEPGNIIEKHAKSRGCSVITTYCGHGINQVFHSAPNIPHYAKNKAVGKARPGMTFTIEPMVSLGSHRDKTWPDNWTSVTSDGSRTAQFEHTLLVTEDGVEVLTARLPDSPGGPVPMPNAEVNGSAAKDAEPSVNGATAVAT